MKFQPLCHGCCSNLTPSAVLTSCQHILCSNCHKSEVNRCPLCLKGYQSIAFNDVSFPTKFKDLMLADPLLISQKALEAQKFQQEQQSFYLHRMREVIRSAAEQNNSLKRKVSELERRIDDQNEDINRLKGMVDTLQRCKQTKNPNWPQLPQPCSRMRSAGLPSLPSPVVGPRIQSGEDPKAMVRNRVPGPPHLTASALKSSAELCTPLASQSVDGSPRSIISCSVSDFRCPSAKSEVSQMSVSSSLATRREPAGREPLRPLCGLPAAFGARRDTPRQFPDVDMFSTSFKKPKDKF
eukprot:EG_transcript_15183